MNTYKITFAIIAAITISLFACDKDDDKDNTAPVIMIHSPMDGASNLMSGDTVDIHIMITDIDGVHESSAELRRTHQGTTDVVWSASGHQHIDEVMIEGEYVISVPGEHNDYILEVNAVDHNNNEATKTASFHVHM